MTQLNNPSHHTCPCVRMNYLLFSSTTTLIPAASVCLSTTCEIRDRTDKMRLIAMVWENCTTEKQTQRSSACWYLHTNCSEGVKAEVESKSGTEAGNPCVGKGWTVICMGHLHLPLCFVARQPETQKDDRGLKGIASSREITTRGLSIKF